MSWSTRPSAPFKLDVQLNADDYRRYFAIVGKRQSNWETLTLFMIAAFAAILVALAFRTLAARETTDPVAIELAGRFSLFAYAAGVFALLLLGSVMRRRNIARTLAGAPHAFDAKTVVLDDDAVTITGKLSEVRYAWPAFIRFTVARGLLCVWIGSQNAVIIPERAFATAGERKSAIAFIECKLAAKQSA